MIFNYIKPQTDVPIQAGNGHLNPGEPADTLGTPLLPLLAPRRPREGLRDRAPKAEEALEEPGLGSRVRGCP